MLNNIVQKTKQKIVSLATKKKFIRNIIEKRQISMEFPASLFIEPTNLCNLKCSMCPQSLSNFESQPFVGAASMRARNEGGQGQSQSLQQVGSEVFPPLMGGDKGEGDERIETEPPLKIEKGFMDFDLYKSIIDESIKFGKRTTIFFHKDGEPLLHPRLPEMIEYAVSRKAAYQTHLSTNAMLLQGKVLEDILKSGIDSIIVNLDAVTPETYEKIKKVPGFEKVEQNVKNFIAMKRSLNLVKPLIRIKLIPVKENLGEIELFKKKWDKLADEVVISREFTWPGLPEDKAGKAGTEPAPTGNLNRYPCISLWLALTINWDGTVSICCIDFYHRGVLGNLRENTIEKLWRGKKLESIRIAHLEGKFGTVPVCSDCKGLWIRDTLGKGAEKWLRAKMKAL